jgi:hypothetical protein
MTGAQRFKKISFNQKSNVIPATVRQAETCPSAGEGPS